METDKNPDYVFKVTFIGSSSVGKTNIISRYAEDVFLENTKTTIGVDFHVKNIFINN